MRKAFKVLIVVFIMLVILFVAFAATVFLDLAAYTATGSQTLTPAGNSVGNALVVYDPRLSGAAKIIADKVAVDLQAANYTVCEAGIKSSAGAPPASFNSAY